MSESLDQAPADKRLARMRLRNTTGMAENTRKYSRLVDRLRWGLPLVAALGLGLLVFWPSWQANQLSAVMVDNVPNLMIEKLNLTGLDEKNHPYALTADRALQAANTKNLIDLDKPKGELGLEGGAWIALRADKGRIDQEAKKLWLGGNVELFHDAGYRFASPEMNADIKSSTAWGAKPVQIQGRFGEINGSGFRVLEGGKTIVVTGPATARLDLRSMSHSDKPSGDKSSGHKPDVNHSASP